MVTDPKALPLLLFVILVCTSCNFNSKQENLLVYCAASMKPAITEIADNFENEFGIKVDIQYGGSGTLLSNFRIANIGDVYLAADQDYMDQASQYGLIKDQKEVVTITPVIAVPRNNPQGIKGIDDLKRKSVRVVLANPEAASIGKHTRDLLTRRGDYDEISGKVVAFLSTVNEVANAIKLGSADVGIVWDATGNQYPGLELLRIPEFENETKKVSIGILNFTENYQSAKSFVDYFSGKQTGQKVLEKLGYIVI